MPRGSTDIPELRLEVIQKFVETFMAPPDLLLSNLFPETDSPSSSIMWESKRGGRGMTPFVPPGSPAPQTAPHGVAQHRAEAAYWKEKMPFDEEFLNNLRKEGTHADYKSATKRLAEELSALVNRSNRRKEWMYAQLLFTGFFNYQMRGGYQATVNYGIPANHNVTLPAASSWFNGANVNILQDIQNGKRLIKEDCGGKVDLAICNSRVLTYLANDAAIRAILQKNAFGDGGLYKGKMHDIVGVNPGIIGGLLDISNFIVYDEMYEVKAWLTAPVSAAVQTWIALDDVSDIVANEVLRFHDYSAGTFEDRNILSVDYVNARVQITQGLTNPYKAMEDYVTMRKYYIPDDKFVMMSTKVDGRAICEFFRAPFGVGRHWGIYTDKNDDWDPEVTWIRVQDKGLPVLYNRDAIYIMDVHVTAAEGWTTTTTTTSVTTTSSSTCSTSSTTCSTSSSVSTTCSTSSTSSTLSTTSTTSTTSSTTSSTSSSSSSSSSTSTTTTTAP